MSSDDLLKKILDIQEQQLVALRDLLKESENNNKQYRDYLEEAKKGNDDYRKSLEESAEDVAKRDAERIEQHEAYIRGAKITRLSNYVRMLSSLALVGLVGYLVIYGFNGS